MANLTANEFNSLKKHLQNTQRNDQDFLNPIRETIVNKAPDSNSLKLCELFNLTVKKKLDNYDAHYLIDLEHVKTLIELRKVSVFMQSVVQDCQQYNTFKTYLHQIDLSLLHYAEKIVLHEKDEHKKHFYAEYFNYNILAHLIAFDASFEKYLIEPEKPSTLLKNSLPRENEKVIH